MPLVDVLRAHGNQGSAEVMSHIENPDVCRAEDYYAEPEHLIVDEDDEAEQELLMKEAEA